jgi:hypothetical protein
MADEVVSGVPWPYPGGRFPDALGAVVQRTVLDGEEPARAVVHDSDDDWLVSDGVNDPNLPGAAVLVCIRHLADADPTLAALADMPPGTVARRADRDDPWTFEVHAYPDDEE